MEKKHIVAFEIGSSCIKGAIGTVDAGGSGRLNVLAVETENLVDKVRYGCVENPGEVASCVNNICHRLQMTVGVAPRAIRRVYVGMSGRSLSSSPCEVSSEFNIETEITRRVIDELMRRAATHSVGDKETIAVEAGTYSIDNQGVLDPEGMFGHTITAHANLIACKTKIRNNIKRVFNERCALDIAGYVVTPLAMGRQLLTSEERRLGVMLVDFGAETTTVGIYREGILVYLATIPMGSRNITRDITSLNCLEERAEEIKKAVGNAMPPATDAMPLVTDGLDNSEINSIIAARADEIISNIYEQINYAGLKADQLPAGIVLTGGGSKLRGFEELLGKQTHLKTRRAALGLGVTIENIGFNVNDSLDVISILAAVAQDDPAECTVMPPHIGEDNNTANQSEGVSNHSGVDAENDEISRIGIDDSGDDDDDILVEDYDPNDEEDIIEKDSKSKKDKSKEKKEKEKNKEKEKESKQGRSNGFWDNLSQQLGKMLRDEEEFEN